MLTSAWFSFGAGTLCTKHLLWLRRSRKSSADLAARRQETDSCPHAGSLKRAARRSEDDVQLVGELGGGAEQSSSILHDPDFSSATRWSPWGHRVLLKAERERVSNPRRVPHAHRPPVTAVSPEAHASNSFVEDYLCLPE